MPIPWIAALKIIPWGDVIEHAPKVLNAARKLMDRQPAPKAPVQPSPPMDPAALKKAQAEAARARLTLDKTRADAADARATLLRSFETNLEENGFWLGQLAASFPVESIAADLRARLAGVTHEDLLARVNAAEHVLYPWAVETFIAGIQNS